MLAKEVRKSFIVFLHNVPHISSIQQNIYSTVQKVYKVVSCFEMNSEAKRWFYPAQVFAQFTSSGEKPAKFIDKQESSRENMANTAKDKSIASDIIQIFETGEMTIAPDYAQVTIVCANVKVVSVSILPKLKSSPNRAYIPTNPK